MRLARDERQLALRRELYRYVIDELAKAGDCDKARLLALESGLPASGCP